MSSLLPISIKRNKPELIAPSKPTPYIFKNLSDIDAQKDLQIQAPFIYFYRNNVEKQGIDPVKVIKEAIRETLVYYYPFAGRARQAPNDKLVIECNGEGIIFIEANANVSLHQFGSVLRPPFPGTGENDLLYNVPDSDGILNCPLLLIQVTRLLCGGFVFAIRLNHMMVDGAGIAQFMTALAEIARGASFPSLKPVWERERLNVQDPHQASYIPPMYPKLHDILGTPLYNVFPLALRSFFFSLKEIDSLRNQVPPHLQKCSKFEILIARLWQCRTIALNLNPHDEVRLAGLINAHHTINPPLPLGFYGNAIGIFIAVSTVSKLCNNQLGHALELVKRAKSDAMNELVQSSLDVMAKKGGFQFTNMRTFDVTDFTRIHFENLDIGWGKAMYGGLKGASGPANAANFLFSSRNNKGEDGIAISMYLPKPVIERFVMVIEKMIREPGDKRNSRFVVSRL